MMDYESDDSDIFVEWQKKPSLPAIGPDIQCSQNAIQNIKLENRVSGGHMGLKKSPKMRRGAVAEVSTMTKSPQRTIDEYFSPSSEEKSSKQAPLDIKRQTLSARRSLSKELSVSKVRCNVLVGERVSNQDETIIKKVTKKRKDVPKNLDIPNGWELPFGTTLTMVANQPKTVIANSPRAVTSGETFESVRQLKMAPSVTKPATIKPHPSVLESVLTITEKRHSIPQSTRKSSVENISTVVCLVSNEENMNDSCEKSCTSRASTAVSSDLSIEPTTSTKKSFTKTRSKKANETSKLAIENSISAIDLSTNKYPLSNASLRKHFSEPESILSDQAKAVTSTLVNNPLSLNGEKSISVVNISTLMYPASNAAHTKNDPESSSNISSQLAKRNHESTSEVKPSQTVIVSNSDLKQTNTIIRSAPDDSPSSHSSTWHRQVSLDAPPIKSSRMDIISPSISAMQLIDPSQSSSKQFSERGNINASKESAHSSNGRIKLSPGVKRQRNRFKSVGPKSPPMKRQLFSPEKPSVGQSTSGKSADDSDQNKFSRNDANILIEIISTVTSQQKILLDSFENFESLLSDTDLLTAKRFLHLEDMSGSFFTRMFFRKHGWHRLSSIQYEDLSSDLRRIEKTLKESTLIDTNIEDIDLGELLKLLKKGELQKLGKDFRVNIQNKRKEVLIEAIINDSKYQMSAKDMFVNNQSSSRSDILKKQVIDLLGSCFKISDCVLNAFSAYIMLFSVFHDVDDEAKRATSQRLIVSDVLNQRATYMDYRMMPIVIFEKKSDFTEYRSALNLRKRFECALEKKNFIEFDAVAKDARIAFEILLANKEYCDRTSKLPGFLKKYTAGSALASILTHYCENFKKKTETSEIICILNILLDQTVFYVGARGTWYELLTLAYTNAKLLLDAASTIIKASKDEFVNEVSRLTLQMKAQMFLKSKIRKKALASVVDELDIFCTIIVKNPASTEINAKAVAGNVQGSRLLYEQTTIGGTYYSSVEERALAHYKATGYPHGIHCEGRIVSSIFCILFFEIIYDETVPGVFQSPFQLRPLDFYSSAFYENRKKAIDMRLLQMATWSAEQVKSIVSYIFMKYGDKQCVVSWDGLVPDVLCEIIKCIGLTALVKICERFAFKPRLARSGFPDLTIWNPAQKKCKFVEVKSPNDRLSSRQRVWMDYLHKVGVECEVCNVRNTAGTSTRLQTLVVDSQE